MNIKPDSKWQRYFEDLYPDEWELQQIGNQNLLWQLAEEGNLEHVPRDIDHWLYFSTNASRKEAKARAIKQGFVVRSESTDSESDFPHGLQLCRSDKTDPQTIDEVVFSLFSLCHELGGNYDGWETEVIRTDLQRG